MVSIFSKKELKDYEQYKAIEEKLGIDLVTLFKALKDGIFKDGYETRLYVYLDADEKWLFTINDPECTNFEVPLSQFGKTWALTKEKPE